MLWLRHPATGLAESLAELPESYRIVALGPGDLVVGPTGMFLVGDGGRNPRVAASRLARLARRCRQLLASELGRAPFVDVLVVASHRHEVDGASVVSPHILLHTLTVGPALLDDTTVVELASTLDRRTADVE